MAEPLAGTALATGIPPPAVLEQLQEPGISELCALLHEMLEDALEADRPIHFQRLKREVYRLRLGDGPARSLVVKRLKPSIAQTDRLVAERWLPALALGRCCPRFLGAAAQRAGDWVWHVYEDVGDESLAVDRRPWRLAVAADLVATLHARGAVHPLLPEIRWLSRDTGAHFLTANLRDAIATLESIPVASPDAPPEFPVSHDRLLQRLHALLDEAPHRVRLLEEAGGPDTLLHGDLWPRNVFVPTSADGAEARLIDWDHVGVGSFSYDLSTLLYRSAPEERPWILQCYRQAVERAGWRLPGAAELNLLFHTAEIARCVHCIVFDAMAALSDEAGWAFDDLMDFERWLEALQPPLPD
jgi:phosphotransferase family enzyme